MAGNEPILIVGPSWVGDTVMAQSLFKLLKSTDNTQIDVLAPHWSIDVLKRMPEVREAILSPFSHGELKLSARYKFGASLRKKKYKRAILLPNTFKSAIIPFAANIPIRTGWLGEYRFGLLNDIRYLDKQQYKSMVERYLALGLPPKTTLPAVFPTPSLTVTEASQHKTLSDLKMSAPKNPVLALCPGAAFGSAKCWPPAYYADLAKQKRSEGYDIWLFGSQNDAWALDHIDKALKHHCIHFGGKLTLDQTIDLLSLATCQISNDSGLMHIGAALDIPVFVLYGPTDPTFTPPLSQKAVILSLSLPCQPCGKRICPLKHHNCMIQLTSEQVLAKMTASGF